MKVSILGDGGWGTALSLLLARGGEEVTVWGAFPAYLREVARTRENRKYLPGVVIPPETRLTSDLKTALEGAEAVIIAVPSQHVRKVCRAAKPHLPPGCALLSAGKGLEVRGSRRMSEVIGEVFGSGKIAVLSGPSHAEEVAAGMPTSVVVAAEDEKLARLFQGLLMGERFRVYTHDDVIGVELGGAIKNVIAIAAGICDGLGFGDNTKAALLSRGLVEIARLGAALGGRPETFWGLSGVGDLIATSCSPYGRNLNFGRLIGEGMSVEKALKTSEMVVEGFKTAAAADRLSRRLKVEMPITREINRVLYRKKAPLRAVGDLMGRLPKAETH